MQSEQKVSTFTEAGSTPNFSGVVLWFNASRGFGFIGRRGGSDVFAHVSGLKIEGRSSLLPGERVEFEVGETEGKPHAVNVRLASCANDSLQAHKQPGLKAVIAGRSPVEQSVP